MTESTPPKPVALAAGARGRRGSLLRLRLLGEIKALGRFFRDRNASILGKTLVVLALAYIVWPADALPDAVPVIGWLDDLGVAALALTYLGHVLKRYRGDGPASK